MRTHFPSCKFVFQSLSFLSRSFLGLYLAKKLPYDCPNRFPTQSRHKRRGFPIQCPGCNSLEQCDRENLKFENLVEEVGTVSWIKSCRGEVLRGIVGSGRGCCVESLLAVLYAFSLGS